MPLSNKADELFKGFSKLSRNERFKRLIELGAINQDDVDYLSHGGIKTPDLADKFIENVIGYYQLPLGVATNFKIDNQDYMIPMAVEETSIIAALSKSARWIRQHGEINTQVIGDQIIGQIQIAKVKDFNKLSSILEKNKQFLIERANEEVAFGLIKRGGGVKDFILRRLLRKDDSTQEMAVIHVFANCCDAMGANILNQILEFLKPLIENLTEELVTMCILSNLNDQKLTQATVTINNVDPELGNRLQEASYFAEIDPYRAATSNKGVLNGIDPVVIATGNDWRAVEAGIHAYAARSGQYSSITSWRFDGKTLTGKLIAPIIVGTVGGVTTLHPTAQLCLRMLGIKHANQLARVLAAVGLVQNLGAIRALTTDGIIKGHMKLHIDNLTLSAGANAAEQPILKLKLEQWLSYHKRVTLSKAIELLSELRHNAKQPAC